MFDSPKHESLLFLTVFLIFPRFNVVWDNRDAEFGELTEYKMFYFLQDDTIAIKELHDGKGGKDPFPLLLKKRKLPKKWEERP
ncbi:jg22163, partial [Pararge aegeria aegeria]